MFELYVCRDFTEPAVIADEVWSSIQQVIAVETAQEFGDLYAAFLTKCEREVFSGRITTYSLLGYYNGKAFV